MNTLTFRILSSVALVSMASIQTSLVAGELTRGPYLQQASSDSIVVVWRTQGESAPSLRFGKSPSALKTKVAGDAISLRVSADVDAFPGTPLLYSEPLSERARRKKERDPSTAANTYQYEASLGGLKPNTKYYYSIFDGEKLLAGGDAEHYFETHPKIGSTSDMRLWVVGDSGTGGKEQTAVHQAMVDFTKAEGRPIDHYLHVGDMAYSDGTDPEFQDHFFEPYQTTLRHTVCWPAMGNHEGHTSRGISGFGPYYDAYVVPTRAEVGGVPSGTEAYYSFDIADTHFVCLDSHDLDRSPDTAMARWLRADLAQANAKWLIAFWHHPPYTKGSHDSDRERQLVEMRETFMPILESAGVDITLTGHSHIYERSMLMDGAYATPTAAEGVILDDGDGDPNGDGAYRKSVGLNPNEGSVSIVSGHGGAGLGREGTMPVMRQIILEHGSLILDIQGDTLTGSMLNLQGEVRDVFSIVKRGKVTPQRIQNPWQPVHDLSLLTSVHFDYRRPETMDTLEHWTTIPEGHSTFTSATSSVTGDSILSATANDAPLFQLYNPWSLHALDIEGQVVLTGSDNPGIALVFAYENDANYFETRYDATTGSIRLSRVDDGVTALVHEREVAVARDAVIEIGVEGEGQEVEIFYLERGKPATELEYKVQLPAPIPAGRVGFALPRGGNAEFLWLEIQDESR